jgi:hypothetical protein
MQPARYVASAAVAVFVLGCSATPPSPTVVPTASSRILVTPSVSPLVSPSPTAPRATTAIPSAASASPSVPPARLSAAPATPSAEPASVTASPISAEELFAIEWQTAALPDKWDEPEGTRVAAGDLGFVVIGVQGVDDEIVAVAYQSDDGTSWSVSRLPAGELAWPTGLTVDGRAVGVGSTRWWAAYVDEGEEPQGEFWTSSDGLTWKHQSLAEGGWPEVVTFGGPGYVAIGYGSKLGGGAPELLAWSSENGRRWSRARTIEHGCEACYDFFMSDVLAREDGIVAIGFGLTEGANDDERLVAWTSADGVAWQISDIPQAARSGHWRALAAGGPGLVAVGEACADVDCWSTQGVVWVSLDGTTWSSVPHQPALAGVNLLDVAPVGDFLVAVGGSPRGAVILGSQDGLEWYRFENLVDVPDDEFVSVAVLDDRIVVVTDFGYVVVGTYAP